MSDPKAPSCLSDPEVQAALAHLHVLIQDIPAHHRPAGYTEVMIVSFYYKVDREILDGGYMSAGGTKLDPNFDTIGSMILADGAIANMKVDDEEWWGRSPEVLDAVEELANSLGDFNRSTMIDHLLVIIPNRESGLSPLAFLNDLPWTGDLMTLSVKIRDLLLQATS